MTSNDYKILLKFRAGVAPLTLEPHISLSGYVGTGKALFSLSLYNVNIEDETTLSLPAFFLMHCELLLARQDLSIQEFSYLLEDLRNSR